MSILVRATAMLVRVVAHRSQVDVSVSIIVRARAMLIYVVAHRLQSVSVSILVRATAMLIHVVAHCSQGEPLHNDLRVEIRSKLPSASCSSPLEDIVQVISAVVIVFEHSFYIFNNQRHYWNSDPSFYLALEQYISSPHAGAVMKAVSDAVYAYEKAVATSGKEKESSCSSVNAQLINAVLEITLNHRLSRP
ncbi:uncharacterized protein F5891DRAFT_1197072 [Suillus fuscotomentosus]|uniref:Uncharacterized protein n=1 Tax=Suillus fuscotomentosus TaxID=1912939 RepID=A0AAD4HE63_9AGAM|nr:uncharacterized protein F5891DRAFT_1197072 [Suillus fuscotomentosus]KAG1892886.1 hypothetical protein F5891DRAFT_1197072 [Suillus fuscotomentosus]